MRNKSRMGRNDHSDPWGFFPDGRTDKQPCYECGALTTGRHHIIPPQLGGTKQIPLCIHCHAILHGADLFHPGRIKKALMELKERGIKLGAPVKMTREVIKTVAVLRKKGKTFKTIAKELNLSVGTVYSAFMLSKKPEFKGQPAEKYS